jgi:hypothetical protein
MTAAEEEGRHRSVPEATGQDQHTMGRQPWSDGDVAVLAEMLHEVSASHGRVRKGVSLARHPRTFARLVDYVLRLPTLDYPLPSTPAGEAIRRDLCARVLGFKVCILGVGVLDVPASVALYLAGQHRTTLRRKLAKASKLGLVPGTLPTDAPTLRRTFDEMERTDYSPRIVDAVSLRDAHCLVVQRADGTPMALALVQVAGQVALIRHFVSRRGYDDSSASRYLLHRTMVECMIDLGVAKICMAKWLLQIPEGVRFFQHVLGFRAARLRLVDAPNEAHRRPLEDGSR